MNEKEYMRTVLFNEEERKELNETYVLDYKKNKGSNHIILKENRTVVIIHMHYDELLAFCFEYILQIPKEIDVYITVSSKQMKKQIENKIQKLKIWNCNIILKNNRGRDLSSLLVACREIILKYEYVCFIHDKRKAGEALEKDTQIWLYNLWDNMLKSNTYINNIIRLFEENQKLGLLLPPKPYGKELNWAFNNIWGRNYDNVVKLAEDLNINYPIRKDSQIAAMSTVFWGKTNALKKLLQREWKYEDFPEEPLALDGTISHALERILSYAAKDMEYEIGVVMNTEYAALQYECMNKLLSLSFELFRNLIFVEGAGELVLKKNRIKECLEYAKGKHKLYIYGAGQRGWECCLLLNKNQVKVIGFVVSDGYQKSGNVSIYPIYQLSEVLAGEGECGFIIALGKKLLKEVLPVLKEKGVNDYFIY